MPKSSAAAEQTCGLPVLPALAAGALALLAVPPAARAAPITFAQFTEADAGDMTQNIVFTRSALGTSDTLNTVDTVAGDNVFFSFRNYASLPAALQGPQAAHLRINGGAGATTTAAAAATPLAGVGTMLWQPFNTAITLAFTRDTPFVPTTGPLAGRSLTNLVTVTIAPLDGTDPTLYGFAGAGALSSSFDAGQISLSFTSDFLSFTNVMDEDGAVSLSAAAPTLQLQGSFLRSFAADLTGTFASDPMPVLLSNTAVSNVPVPEPASLALLGIGLLRLVHCRAIRAPLAASGLAARLDRLIAQLLGRSRNLGEATR